MYDVRECVQDNERYNYSSRCRCVYDIESNKIYVCLQIAILLAIIFNAYPQNVYGVGTFYM